MRKIEGCGFDCYSGIDETKRLIRQRKIEAVVVNIFCILFLAGILFLVAFVLHSVDVWINNLINS